MTGNFHDNRIVNTGFSHVGIKRMTQIMKNKTGFDKAVVFYAAALLALVKLRVTAFMG